jgi:peptidyl-prolyl cis-trans isomerase B (cyclophilin B)
MVKAYLTINAGSEVLGRLDLVLYEDTVPKTVKNFCELMQRESGKGYIQSTFHRIIKGFMAQGGDFTNGDGTGGESIYGKTFSDENFLQKHNKAGLLSMANAGRHTNGSQFFITFQATPHLDGKHVVFGHVDLTTTSGSGSVLKAMENVRTGRDDRPIVPLTISECGVISSDETPSKADEEDENEIDLEDDKDANKKPSEPAEIDEIELPDEEEEEPKTKAQALRQRMRKLKMKMNQARQLNKQELTREGERLGSVEGVARARKAQTMKDKKLKDAEWSLRNAKALEVAAAFGMDGKHLVEQADVSLVRRM